MTPLSQDHEHQGKYLEDNGGHADDPSDIEEGGDVMPLDFDTDIRPLFSDHDVEQMQLYGLDLTNPADVLTHSSHILERLNKAGRTVGAMPCDGRWPQEDINAFEQWMTEKGTGLTQHHEHHETDPEGTDGPAANAPDAVQHAAPMDHPDHASSHAEHAAGAPHAVEHAAPMDHAGHGGTHADHSSDIGERSAPMEHADHADHPSDIDEPGAPMEHADRGGSHAEHTRDATDAVEHAAPMDHTGRGGPHAEHGGHAPDAAEDGAPMDHTGHGGPQAEHARDAEGHGAHVDHTGHELMFRNRFWVSLVLTVPVLLYSSTVQGWLDFTMPTFTGSTFVTPVFAVVVFLYGGVPFLQMAPAELRRRQPGMMTLISMAIGVAFVYSLLAFSLDLGEGFFWELVTLIDVMLLGHWIEMRSVRQASGALNELAKLMPDTAERVEADGGTQEVRVGELRLDDTVLVRPGANIAADGTVLEGESEVDEALLTGESSPVRKTAGARVIAGAINGAGSLRVRVTAIGDKTALAGIMRLVAEAQESRSRVQVLADSAAGWLFYGAISIVALTAVVWVVAIGFEGDVVKRAVTVLVIACPHALGLAIPLVVAISTAKAADNGILVRNRLALEAARSVDFVIFDKTGTLTTGEQGVAAMASFDGLSDNQALALTSAIEGDSEHIIARAIQREAEARGLSLPDVSGFEAIKGRGVRAKVDGRTFYVGGPQLLGMLETAPSQRITEFADAAGSRGQTVVHLVEDGLVVASFALSDAVRPESKQAVQRLRQAGIEVAMLTGDSRAVAETVAKELDIDTYFAEVLPEHKDQKVAELQGQGKRVAMVGDGVNDAPALTRADLGIAIGSGTDVAVESADIILVNSNPVDVVKIVALSRATYRKMLQNLVWATGYNVVALPLAAGVLAPIGFLLSPAVGALFMSLSTVIVAVNAQLLRRARI